jgi:hypothetical protein
MEEGRHVYGEDKSTSHFQKLLFFLQNGEDNRMFIACIPDEGILATES